MYNILKEKIRDKNTIPSPSKDDNKLVTKLMYSVVIIHTSYKE